MRGVCRVQGLAWLQGPSLMKSKFAMLQKDMKDQTPLACCPTHMGTWMHPDTQSPGVSHQPLQLTARLCSPRLSGKHANASKRTP